jgi:prepilin-type N-terminal cleavage/methylation domain-containing protein
MLAKLRQMKEDEGFTLVELLVVIAILGILAGIVVFSVAGITNNGQAAACATEKGTLVTAEEAYYAQNKSVGYVTDTVLKSSGFLATSPSWYNVTVTGGVYTVAKNAAGTAAGCT